MRMKRNPCIRRGGCYWVENLNAVGHEMMKTRPAVVVSCGALAGTSRVTYIHPKGRFHMVEFETPGGALRECFLGVGDR